MKHLWIMLFIGTASAQPPGYTCTHWNDYYAQGAPPAGSPNECEAVGNAAQGSFIYFFPASQASSDPPALAAPEVSVQGSIAALTLLLGVLAISGAKYRRQGRC